MIHRALFSSAKTGGTDDWATNPNVYARLHALYGPFDLDPCGSLKSPQLCQKQYTVEDDGLKQPWFGMVYCNPPYSQIQKWVEKALSEIYAGTAVSVTFLVPARTDTKWFDLLFCNAQITFVNGRLRFGDQKNSAPFPSLVLHLTLGPGSCSCLVCKNMGRSNLWLSAKTLLSEVNV